MQSFLRTLLARWDGRILRREMGVGVNMTSLLVILIGLPNSPVEVVRTVLKQLILLMAHGMIDYVLEY